VRVEERIEIALARDEVFDFVADHRNDPKWCRKVKSVQPIGDGRWKIWHRPVPLRPAVVLEAAHLRMDPPANLAMREEDAASVFDVEYRLDEIADGTQLTQASSSGRSCRALCREFWHSESDATSQPSYGTSNVASNAREGRHTPAALNDEEKRRTVSPSRSGSAARRLYRELFLTPAVA
jgi:hypothetical protein